MSDDDKKDDATRVGGGPPAAPKLPGAGSRSPGEGTRHGGAPPVLPGKPGPPPAGSAPPPEPPAESEETIAVGQVTERTPFSLQRVQPPGHTGVVYLTGQTYLLGRKHGADLPLFSPTASREHARLEFRADGWYLEPSADNTVIANGSVVRGAVRLEHKMRLQIGGDELIFFDESVAVAGIAPARAAAAPSGRSRRGRWIAIAVVLGAAAVALAWLVVSARG